MKQSNKIFSMLATVALASLMVTRIADASGMSMGSSSRNTNSDYGPGGGYGSGYGPGQGYGPGYQQGSGDNTGSSSGFGMGSRSNRGPGGRQGYVDGMEDWTPGKQRGKAVRVKYLLPVEFK